MGPKVFLRLDDGSLIGRAADLGANAASANVIRLPVDQAVQLGRAGEKEVARLQTILDRIRKTYNITDAALEQARFQPPSKKVKRDPILTAPSGGFGAWTPKAHDLLKKLVKHFGKHWGTFYYRVDPKLLPDYYNVVKQPLFLGDIEGRLKAGQYHEPGDFYADIKHFFSNVYLYNPPHDPFRQMGEEAERYFDGLWAATNFSEERTRRATAGQAAPKFDPEEMAAPAKPKPSRSQGGQAAKRPRDGVDRSMSHEVTSVKHGIDENGRVTQERIQQIGMYLSREDLPDEHSAHLISLLPPETVAGMESGEIELDFDTMDNETLLKIDAWLRTIPEAQAMFGLPPPGALQPQPPPPAPPQPARPSNSRPRLDWDDDDEDYEAESEDDSD